MLLNSFREKLRRTGNFFERNKEFRIERYSNPREVPAAMAKLLRVSRNSWKFKARTAIASSPESVSFHSDLARLGAEKGWLKMLILCRREEPLAFTFEFRYGETIFFLKTGFDENFSRLSPGIFLAGQGRESVNAQAFP